MAGLGAVALLRGLAVRGAVAEAVCIPRGTHIAAIRAAADGAAAEVARLGAPLLQMSFG